jgi:hypothetical protein
MRVEYRAVLKQIALAVSIGCAIAAASAVAAAAPAELERMRKAFGAAVAKHDVKAAAKMTHFPLAFSGYEHPDKVTAAQFAGEFDGLFFGGDAQMANCLATGKLEPAQTKFPSSPWMIDCDGNEYYFGQRNGKWMFTAYENINE